MKDLICTNQERCGREAGYCETCVEAMVQDERERCAKIAETMGEAFCNSRMHEAARAIAAEIRRRQTE